MPKIQHFLLTRFNLHLESFDKNYTGRWVGADSDYLNKRFALFERFCLPSVIAQDADFIWIIFFSTQTPERFKQIISGWARKFSKIRPIFIDDLVPLKDEGRPEYVRIVKEFINDDTEYVITSRIDNDDALGRDALNNCKEASLTAISTKRYKSFFVSAVNGFAYNDDYNLLQRYYYKTNHFPSLVSAIEKFDATIFSYSHVEIYSKGRPVVEIDAPCQWLEVVHSCNLDNTTGLYRPFIPLEKEWMKRSFNVVVESPNFTEPLIVALSRELEISQKKLAVFKGLLPIRVLLAIKNFLREYLVHK